MDIVVLNIFILNVFVLVSSTTPIDNVQLSYLNNKKVQNFIQDPTNSFVFTTTTTVAETSTKLYVPNKRKPIDTLIKFLRSITPSPVRGTHNKNNQCWSNPCLHGSSCYGSANSYLCVCLRGWTGLNCAEKIQTHQDCSNEFCNSHGFCQIKALSSPQANLKFCNCWPHFTGQRCEIEIRPSNKITTTSTVSFLKPTKATIQTTTTTTTTKTTTTTQASTSTLATPEEPKLYKKLSNIPKTKIPKTKRLHMNL